MAGFLKGKKVIVVGTGIGGSGVSALLAKEGADVLVLERNPFPGGKAASFDREGFVYDSGVHWLARGARGPLGEIAREVGAEVAFRSIDEGIQFNMGGRSGTLPVDMDDERSMKSFFSEMGVLPEHISGAWSFVTDVMRERTPGELEELDGVSLADHVLRFTPDERFFGLIEAFTGIYMVIGPRQSSAGEFIICLSTHIREKSLSYPLGGMRAVPLSYLKAMVDAGGEVRYSSPVEGIVVEGGRVKGVEADGFIAADMVISNTGIKETVDLVGRRYFPDDYVKMVDNLRLSYGGVSVKYALDAEVVKPHIIFHYPDMTDARAAERQAAVFIPVPSAVDPSLAPPGCQMVLVASLAPQGLEDPEAEDRICEEVINRIENTMIDIFPDIERHVIWKMRTNTRYIAQISGRRTGEVVGLAQNRHQVGRNRPKNQTPVEGLFLVGADTGGRGVGTEMAADSALSLWRTLS
ncbi:MAG: NAD(P)/FAD-dependent oxidoreductase [Deltaproteobacteria bacterium]|nr:NAD(P)/FAD-dependent oxidoreductase [Deltaproteobacteria bacterium]